MSTFLWGKVRNGKKRGKRLGFPTANLHVKKTIPEGIYISKAKIGNKIYNSLTFIGKAETFGESDYQAETYIFSLNKSLYNSWISVQLLKKIRDNKKFTSEKALIEQMEKDKKVALDYFAKNVV